MVIGWQEHLSEEELPPEWMWPLPWELKAWFDEVRANRASKKSGGGSGDSESPMMANQLAEERRK